MHYKEVLPEETIKKLKKILEDVGIEVEENSKLESEIGTHSIRVVFNGTDFGANGKGVSEKYCLASAYAEFFERYQNDLTPQWKVNKKSKYSFKAAFDEKILDTAELVSDSDNAFVNFYFSQRNLLNASFEERVDAFESVQKTDFWQFDFKGKYVCLPFYSVKHDKIVYLPRGAYSLYYGSNGMCAGNSPEEALVQGLSEIIERIAQRRIFIEQSILPDVPDEYIRKFPYVYDLVTKLRENKEFVCKVKDCSFKGKYPVAALVILEKNTGKLGVKLGCHPDFGVAMERTITEAAQGNNIYKIVERSRIDFKNLNVTSDSNICNSFKVSAAQFPYQIIGENSAYDFTPPKDVSLLSNGEILKQWVDGIILEGYDVLIRDVSSFGFPSFQIIIPGLSELQNADDLKIKAVNTKMFIQTLLLHPEKIDKNNVKYIISTLNYFRDSLLENNINQYFVESNTYEYPGNEINCGLDYMLTMCYMIAEDFANAELTALHMYNCAINSNSDKKVICNYLAIYYYISAMVTLKNHNKVMEYISAMFDANITEKLEWLFGTGDLIGKQYPCGKVVLSENNPYNIVFESRERLLDAQVKTQINQINIRKLFYN